MSFPPLGSVHTLSTAYYPQTNGTECVNWTLKTAIRAYVGDRHAVWDEYLLQICIALRTTPHDSTGFSTPLNLITHPSSESVNEPGVSYPYPLYRKLLTTVTPDKTTIMT